MIVTLLEAQKKDPSRVNLYIDDTFFCGISLNIVAKYSLYAGKAVPEDVLNDLFFEELKTRFLERTLDWVSGIPKTEKQTRQYIKELAFKKKGKWFDVLEKDVLEKLSNYVIHKLLEYGYIDDRKYAEMFVNSRIKNKPRGKGILISELIVKGVSKDIAEEVTNELVEDEYSLLNETYSKKYKEEKISLMDRKKIDFLRRKGFDWDLIEKYINNQNNES